METIANEVEIVVTADDRTAAAFASAEAKAKKAAAGIAATVGKAGRDGGEQFAAGIDAGMQKVVRDAEGRARDARGRFVKGFGQGAAADGAKLGGGLASAFGQAATTMFARSGVAGAAAVVGGLATLPAAAGLIGASVGASFGAGIAGIGIAAAAQSSRVKAEFSDLKFDVLEGLRGVSGPLEDTLLRIPDLVRQVGSGLRPSLGAAFDEIAESANRFIQRIADGAVTLGPHLVDLGRGFGDVLDAIGDKAPEIFEDLGDGFSKFAQLATDHADDVASAIEFMTSAFEASADVLQWFSEQFGQSAEQQAAWTRQMVEMAGGVDAFRAQMAALGEPASEVEASLIAAGLVTREVGSAARDAASGVGDLAAEFEAMTGGALELDEAASRYQEAFDRASEAVRRNGESLSINTAKGRENRGALRDMATAAQEHLALMGQEGAGLGEITDRYQAYRGQLISAARQAGASRKEARDLADAWLAMPKSVQTLVTARTQQAEGAIQRVRNLMASFGSKTVYLTVQQVLRTVPGVSLRQLMQAHGGNIGGTGTNIRGFQTGGVSGAGSSMAVVGEQGPELVRLPVGSTVIPAGQSASMMSSRAASSISMAFRGGQQQSRPEDLSKSIKDLTKELRDIITLREGMEKFTSGVMGQGRAFMAYEAALDRAAASVKKNGKTLNINREKGRENRGALMDLAQAAHEATFAMNQLGRPASSIVAKMKEQRAEFIKVARTMGLTTKEAKALADKWGLLPNTVKGVLAKEAKDKAYNKAAEAFNKTLKTKASGGPTGGMTLVGESGPELVRLPFGSSVVPAGQTAGMMGGGPGVLHVTLQIGQTQLGELVIDPLRKSIRTRGGNVQAVLGRG